VPVVTTLPQDRQDSEETTTGPSVHLRVARTLLWLAVTLPFIYTTAKTASEVAAGGSVGSLEVVRGGGPMVLLGLSLLIAPIRRRGFGAPEVFLCLYVLVVFMSALIPANPSSHATILKALTLAAVLLAMSRLVRLYDCPRDVIVALTGWVHLALIAGLVEILFFKSSVYTTNDLDIGGDGLARLNLVIPSVSANPLAFLGVAGILSCAVGLAPRWLHFNGLVRTALMGVYVYEIYLTRTRSALVVGLVIVALSIILRARRHPLSSLLTAIVFLVGGFLLMPTLLPHLHDFLRRGQTAQAFDTLSGRTIIWDAAYQVWHHNQTFGLGYYSGHRLGIPGLSQNQSNIDNTWLETLVDVGLVGLIPLALFAVTGTWRLCRNKDLHGDARLWALGSALYVLAISFINPTIQSVGAPQVVLTILILAVAPGTAVNRGSSERAHDGGSASRTPPHGSVDRDHAEPGSYLTETRR
jgi:O-antigen ligase